jgi:hypothetical protein
MYDAYHTDPRDPVTFAPASPSLMGDEDEAPAFDYDEEDVAEIRKPRADGTVHHPDLAHKFGVMKFFYAPRDLITKRNAADMSTPEAIRYNCQLLRCPLCGNETKRLYFGPCLMCRDAPGCSDDLCNRCVHPHGCNSLFILAACAFLNARKKDGERYTWPRDSSLIMHDVELKVGLLVDRQAISYCEAGLHYHNTRSIIYNANLLLWAPTSKYGRPSSTYGELEPPPAWDARIPLIKTTWRVCSPHYHDAISYEADQLSARRRLRGGSKRVSQDWSPEVRLRTLRIQKERRDRIKRQKKKRRVASKK